MRSRPRLRGRQLLRLFRLRRADLLGTRRENGTGARMHRIAVSHDDLHQSLEVAAHACTISRYLARLASLSASVSDSLQPYAEASVCTSHSTRLARDSTSAHRKRPTSNASSHSRGHDGQLRASRVSASGSAEAR